MSAPYGIRIVGAPVLTQRAAEVTEIDGRLVKLADKIANLRDLVEFPPADWPAYRRREYFDWAAEVVATLRGTHPQLEALFDDVQALRPA